MSAVIAYCALVFTLTSFWWLHVRRGRLVASAPTTYAGFASGKRIRLRLPLIVHNTGPVPLVIEEMRIHVDGQDETWPWMTLRSRLKPDTDDVLDFTSSTLVSGRDAVQIFVEFGSNEAGWLAQPAVRQSFTVAVRERTRDWRDLVSFELEFPGAKTIGNYIAHRASGCDCT